MSIAVTYKVTSGYLMLVPLTSLKPYKIEVSGQLHAPTVLPPTKQSPVSILWVDPTAGLDYLGKRTTCSNWESNADGYVLSPTVNLPCRLPHYFPVPYVNECCAEADAQRHLPRITNTNRKPSPSYNILNFTFRHQNIASTHIIDTMH
jgi:hypothetical protein